MRSDFGKFRYNTKYEIEFDRMFTMYRLPQTQKQFINEALDGTSEALNYFTKKRILIQRDWISGLEKSQLEHWFDYVKDGSTFEFWLNANLAKYISFERNTAVDIDLTTEPTGYTRSGAANYIDAQTGLVTALATDEAPFELSRFDRSAALLLDKGVDASPTENLITISEDLSNPVWIKAAGVTITADDIISPDGTATADKYVTAAPTSNATFTPGVTIGTNDGAFSVWARVMEGTQTFTIRILDHVGTSLASEICTATTEWQRFKVTYINPGSSANGWSYRMHLDLTGAEIWFWGMQGEVGAWSTSYAKDGTGRNAGTFVANLANFNERQFSISFWHKPAAIEVTGIERRYIQMHNAGGAMAYLRLKTNGDLEFAWQREDGTNTVVESWAGTHGLTQDTWHHFVIAYDSEISNGLNIYINGVNVHSPTLDPIVTADATSFWLGSNASVDSFADGLYDEILFENKVINQSEVTERYNRISKLGLNRNYFETVRLVPSTLDLIPMPGSDLWAFSAELDVIE